VFDFLCRSKRLVVELDGEQHVDSVADIAQTAFLNRHGYSVLRFWNPEALHERKAVLDAILAVLDGQLAGTLTGLRYAPATLTRSLRDSTSPVPGEDALRVDQNMPLPKDGKSAS
jgi:hypothetical protein